ncbi:MAG: nuclear transport factor 2 family protein [Pseudomonadales bacterium]|nr:nuclear transport factor 2 family protein [Pseudomonadales bacterium]
MTVTPPALSQTSSEYDDVKLLILNAIEIIRSDHFDDYFDLFTEDAVWMMPSSDKDVGIDEARNFYGFTRKFRFDQETSIDELVVREDWAYVRITFDGYLRSRADESAPPLRSVSRHIWILRKELDNSWKIARDIWNTPKRTA